MKTIRLFFSAFFLITATFFISCQGDNQGNKEDESAAGQHASEGIFQCPMKCEGDKTYATAGKCPDCGMDLEKTNENDAENKEDAEQ